MNATVDPDSPIGREARAWALAVFGEPFPPERSEDLRRWLDADPRHAEAYAGAEQLVMGLAYVEALKVEPARARVLVGRPVRWLAAGAALAASLVVGVTLSRPPAPMEGGPSARELALKDGSTVVLAPGARLQASRWTDRRYVLERGEAFFAVRKAEGRRFQVEVGQAEVEVLGTRFDARAGASGQVRVAVQEGLVAVYDTTGQDRRLAAKLGAGTYVVLEGGRAQQGEMADASEAGAWRAGRLAYASAPLGDVVADINARKGERVMVTRRAATLRVNASFHIDQADGFIASLPQILPVTISTATDGVRTIDVRGAGPSQRR